MAVTELIEKVKQQDQQAFEELYNQFYPAGFSLALQFVKNEEDALDIMQDVFITVYSKLDSLEDASKFKSWYMQIVANKCRDFLKKQNPLSFTDANAYDEEGALQFEIEETDRDFIPEEAVDYSETVRIVDQMIAELPEEQRMCILLYFANDMKIPEIAAALGVSEATVKSRLKYGKDKIRAKTEDYQKKTGTKLYSISGLLLIPFIRWALSQKPASAPQNSGRVFQNIWSAVSSQGQNAATVLQQTTQTAASVPVDAAVKAGNFLQQLSNLPAAQKVIGGIAAGVILLGSSAGIASKLAAPDPEKTTPPTTAVTIVDDITLPVDTTPETTVAVLEEIKEIDIFPMITDYIVYTGSNGNAYAHFDFPQNYQQSVSDRICLDFFDAEITVNVDGTPVGSIDLSLLAPNPEVIIKDNLEFIFDESGPLTNGEILTVELGDYELSQILKELKPLGYTIQALTYELEVSGL